MHTHHAAKRKFLVLPDGGHATKIGSHDQELVPEKTVGPERILYYVIEQLSSTTAPHGIHQDEMRRLSGTCQYLLTLRHWLWFITIGDGIQQLPPGEARALVDAVFKALVTMQRKEGLEQYWVMVWHCTKGLHAHIICLANRRILDALKKSARFGQYIDIRWIYDVHRLAKYLSKEMTPQAYLSNGRRIRRKKGAHQLPGGGDRVRLSSALKEDAIAAGYVTPWKPTNAKRKPPEARASNRPRQTKSSEAPSRPSLAR
jgi:hypothetical protein